MDITFSELARTVRTYALKSDMGRGMRYVSVQYNIGVGVWANLAPSIPSDYVLS